MSNEPAVPGPSKGKEKEIVYPTIEQDGPEDIYTPPAEPTSYDPNSQDPITVTKEGYHSYLNRGVTRPRAMIPKTLPDDIGLSSPWLVSTPLQLLQAATSNPEEVYNMLTALREERDYGFVITSQLQDSVNRGRQRAEALRREASQQPTTPQLPLSASPTIQSSNSKMKFPDPPVLEGIPGEYPGWAFQMDNKVGAEPDYFVNEAKKVSYTIGRLGKDPLNHVITQVQDGGKPFLYYVEIMKFLASMYDNAAKKAIARATYRSIYMSTSESFNPFFARFRTAAVQSGIRVEDLDTVNTIDDLVRKLPTRLQDEWYSHGHHIAEDSATPMQSVQTFFTRQDVMWHARRAISNESSGRSHRSEPRNQRTERVRGPTGQYTALGGTSSKPQALPSHPNPRVTPPSFVNTPGYTGCRRCGRTDCWGGNPDCQDRRQTSAPLRKSREPSAQVNNIDRSLSPEPHPYFDYDTDYSSASEENTAAEDEAKNTLPPA